MILKINRLRPLVKFLAAGFFCCFSVILFANESEYFFSTTGEDLSNCTGGDRSRPWRSLALQYNRGCIQPGSKVYFKAGIYNSASEVFNGRLNLTGSKEKPIIISADPGSNELWPVKFRGDFIISNAENLIIDGIEFIMGDKVNYALAIGANNITIQNSKVHGLEGSYSKVYPSRGDCIKIAGGNKAVENVKILNNEIYNCPEDAIDITGRKDILVKGNHIYNAWIIQIKGGAENIVYDGNVIHDMRYGITSNGMDCSKASIYCGNPMLPTLPVEERFEAKNVTIINNSISNILKGRAIDFTGWRNVLIKGNTITNGNIASGSVIQSRNNVVSVFLDKMAKDYCGKLPENCVTCRLGNGLPCWKIKFQSKNVEIVHNSIEGSTPVLMAIEKRAVTNPLSICESNNQFALQNGSPKFIYEDRTFERLQEYPICHKVNSSPSKPIHLELTKTMI